MVFEHHPGERSQLFHKLQFSWRFLSLTVMWIALWIKTVHWTKRTTFSIKELLKEVALWAWIHQEGCHPIKVKGRCKHIFGVPHDIDDLQWWNYTHLSFMELWTLPFSVFILCMIQVIPYQLTKGLPVHVMDFLEKIHVKTFIKFIGPCKILQLYSAFLFFFGFRTFATYFLFSKNYCLWVSSPARYVSECVCIQ